MIEKDHDDKLRKVALSLMRKEPLYFGDFPETLLMAWLSDRGTDYRILCAYCDLPLLTSSPECFRSGTMDHLLPKRSYPWLVLETSNGVPCCYRCNNMKSSWDPIKIEPVYEHRRDGNRLYNVQRHTLIERARKYLDEKRKMTHATVWQNWVQACGELDSNDGSPAEKISSPSPSYTRPDCDLPHSA